MTGDYESDSDSDSDNVAYDFDFEILHTSFLTSCGKDPLVSSHRLTQRQTLSFRCHGDCYLLSARTKQP